MVLLLFGAGISWTSRKVSLNSIITESYARLSMLPNGKRKQRLMARQIHRYP